MVNTSLVGQTIGNYQIVSEIGRGGMATVYKAHQISLNRYVALKVLPDYFAHNAEFLARFKQEAIAAARLQHPNIVQIYEAGESSGTHFIAMEYVDGESLHTLMQRRAAPLDVPTAVNILSQVGSALDYAHSQGVIHRDIKPSNILVDARGRAMLMDFGIARAIEFTRLTQAGVSIGTPEYMAPEQAEGAAADARSDLYSLGVVLYQMLTGRVPFTGASPTAVMFAHVHKPPPPPCRHNPALSPAVEKVILKALAKRPQERYQSASEIVHALRGAGAVFEGGQPQPQRAAAFAPILLGTLIGMMLICALIVFAVSSSRGVPPAPISVPTSIAISTPAGVPVGIAPTPTTAATPMPTMSPLPALTMTPTRVPTLTPSLPPTATGTSTSTPTPLPTPTLTLTRTPAPTATPTATLTATPPPTLTPSGPPGMVLIPAGVFWMGAAEDDPSALADEKPGHFVDVSAFYIDQYEVSNAEYRQCVNAGVCSKPTGVYARQSPHLAYGNPAFDNYPVVFVSFGMASQYCVWKGKRLPYETEFEKAARGTADQRIYPWGSTWDGYRANAAQRKPGPLAVKSYSDPADPKTYGCSHQYGVCNLIGNVWEWIADYYDSQWYAESIKNIPLPNIIKDPINWKLSPRFVIRGGSFRSNIYDARLTKRDGRNGAETLDDVGFRCALSVK